MEKMWAGRFHKSLDCRADDFNSSIRFDSRMYKQDIKGSVAHATMLASRGIIAASDAEKIIEGLGSVLDDIEQGKLQIDPTAEDIHMFVEAELTKRIGDVGKRLHTARSRNDQVAVDIRLYLRDEAAEITDGLKELLAAVLKKAKEKGCVKVYPIGAISKGLEGKELSEMGDMQEAGAVAVSDDGRPVMSSGLMKKAMIYSAQFQLPIISHCEDLDLTDDGYMNEGCCSTMLGLRGIPRAAEDTGLPVHIAHVSTKLAAELIRQAKARGVRVTCETCPHYFTLTDHAVIGFDTNAKVNPPLREQADVEAIIAALQDGTIDMIATDHAPHHADEKNVEFALAANGISGFETAFGLSYTYLVKAGHLTFPELVRKMSVNPGRFLRIGSRLAAGAAADITLAALEEEYTVDVRQFVSKGKNSPFDGFRLFGRIAGTIVNGRIVYGIGRIAAAIA